MGSSSRSARAGGVSGAHGGASELQQVDINSLVGDVVSFLEPQALQQAIEIVFHPGEIKEAPMVEQSFLKQIVMNLIINSIQAFEKSDIPLEVIRLQHINPETNKLEDFTASYRSQHKIRLKADNRFFTVEFSLFDFFNTDNVRYSHKITGFQDEWVYTKDNELLASGKMEGELCILTPDMVAKK